MPDERNNIYLYEAIELRAEYNSRLETLRSLLPENQSQTSGGLYSRNSGNNQKLKPVKEFNVDDIRSKVKKLENKNRKLNIAIQKTNFETYINFKEREINLTEALELRKNINEEIKKLSKQLKKSAYKKVIYKEERNIVEEPDLSYEKVRKELEERRIEFRQLNRKLRKISFETVIDFKDEK